LRFIWPAQLGNRCPSRDFFGSWPTLVGFLAFVNKLKRANQLIRKADREGLTDLGFSDENNRETFHARFCRQGWFSELRDAREAFANLANFQNRPIAATWSSLCTGRHCLW
jgi:hypothetical protein